MRGPEGGPHRILVNPIYDNGETGIDLGADGETLNDSGDADLGVNCLQNYPTFRNMNFTPGIGLPFQFTVESLPTNAAYPFQVEVSGSTNRALVIWFSSIHNKEQ